MADYNTRGEKHGVYGKDYDYKYNSGYAWNPVFNALVADRLAYNRGIDYSYHLNSYDSKGNRVFDASEITIQNLRRGTVVEIETEILDIRGRDVEIIRKAVIRLPERSDGEQIVAVALFKDNGYLKIKTAWLNKATDNHQQGLDTSDMDWNIGGIFGVRAGRFEEFYNIDRTGKSKKVRI